MNTFYLSDKQVSVLLGVSMRTLSRVVKGGVGNESILKNIRPVKVLGHRKWAAPEIAKAVGITEEELVRRFGLEEG